MGFERFNLYKKQASLYDGEELTNNALAIKLKEECPYAWKKVRGNNKNIYPGEKRLDNWNPIENKPDPGAIWMYRPNDQYDSVLFAKLFIKFQGVIYNSYRGLQHYIDVDDYLDEMEDCLCQVIRHFDPSKDCNFTSLMYSMVKLWTINCVHKKASVSCKKKDGKNLKDERGHLIKTITYDPIPASIEEMMEAEDGRKYELPFIKDSVDTMTLLRKKYISIKDPIAWCLVDLYSDDSILQQTCNLDNILSQNIKDLPKRLSLIKTRQLVERFSTTEIYDKLGFKNSKLSQLYSAINESIKDLEKRQRQKVRTFNKFYQESLTMLRQDIIDYELGA